MTKKPETPDAAQAEEAAAEEVPKKKPPLPPVLARAVDHARSQETRKIEVPEWGMTDEGGKIVPLIVYAPPLNLTTISKISMLSDGDIAKVWALTLIYGAKDEDGSPLFTMEHMQVLMDDVDGDVVSRLAQWIRGHDLMEALEDRVKKFGAIQDD